MSAVFERSFRVRLYECDAYGHVNHANYLRYMQEAALDASAAVGYNKAWYDAAGRYWLILQTGITYLRPLQFEDTVIIKTWVSDFRRATSRRRYELRIAASGELAAEGFSDWVYLDTAILRPVRIPLEMVEAFTRPGGLPPDAERDSFPEQPPVPEGAYRMQRRTRWSEIDPAGHVNNAAYFTFFEDCAMELMVDRGWPAARMHADGFGVVAREFRIQYQSPALLDDVLEVSTWISEVKRASVLRHYVIKRVGDDEPIVRAQALWVWIDLASGRPLRIPEQYLQAFADNVFTVSSE
jgi:acyl-CoA thioester hydrolase